MIFASITPKKIGEIFRFHINGTFTFYKVVREVKALSSISSRTYFYEIEPEAEK